MEGCDTRYGNKIGRSAIGKLTRSGNKEIINLFPEGTQMIENFQGAGKTLMCNDINRKDHKKTLDQCPDTPKISTKRYLNKLRISARCLLLRRELLIKKVCDGESVHGPYNFKKVEEWNYAREMEGVLSVSKIIV